MNVLKLSTTKHRYTARQPGAVDLYRQQRIYQAITGDREDYIGFPRRLADWSEKHRLTSLLDSGVHRSTHCGERDDFVTYWRTQHPDDPTAEDFTSTLPGSGLTVLLR